MGVMSVLSFAQKLVVERVQPGEVVVDATLGTGNDTLFLAERIGPRGILYGFDIQRRAIEQTTTRLSKQPADSLPNVRLFEQGHENMMQLVAPQHHGKIAAVMFNLGFLPGSDVPQIITVPETTMPALTSACHLLRVGGIITVAIYPGHDGGQHEAHSVERWASNLDQRAFDVLLYRMLNRRNHPPYLIAIEKKKTP